MKNARRRALSRWAFVLGIVGAVMAGLVLWFVQAFAEGLITNPAGWLIVLFPLFSVAIAFKWPVAGGVLLILEGVPLIGQVIILITRMSIIMSEIPYPDRISWLMLVPIVAGLLLLASGILFIISWRHRQKD